MRVRTVVLWFLVLALVAAACGGEDESTTTGAPGSTAASSETTSAATEDPGATDSPPLGGEAVVPVSTRCEIADPTECNLVDAAAASPVQGPECLVVPAQIVTPVTAEVLRGLLANSIALGAEIDLSRVDVVDIAAAGGLSLPGGLSLLGLSANTPDVLDLLNAAGLPSSSHHYVLPTPKWKWGPGGGAAPVPSTIGSFSVPPVGATGGGPTSVTVIDTGYPANSGTFGESHPAGVTEEADIDLHFRGHGLFVAGVVRQLAPDATIVMRKPFALGALASIRDDAAFVPAATEAEVWEQMLEASTAELQGGGYMNISGGTYACSPDDVPLMLAAASKQLGDAGITLVASAGNDALDPFGSGDPVTDLMYPAGYAFDGVLNKALASADPDLLALASVEPPDPFIEECAGLIGEKTGESIARSEYENTCVALRNLFITTEAVPLGNVISVGALDVWAPEFAVFSNRGATHWAPGVNVVSNYADSLTWTVRENDTERTIKSTGAVQWDGTSFAAPYITGLLASDEDIEMWRDAFVTTSIAAQE